MVTTAAGASAHTRRLAELIRDHDLSEEAVVGALGLAAPIRRGKNAVRRSVESGARALFRSGRRPRDPLRLARFVRLCSGLRDEQDALTAELCAKVGYGTISPPGLLFLRKAAETGLSWKELDARLSGHYELGRFLSTGYARLGIRSRMPEVIGLSEKEASELERLWSPMVFDHRARWRGGNGAKTRGHFARLRTRAILDKGRKLGQRGGGLATATVRRNAAWRKLDEAAAARPGVSDWALHTATGVRLASIRAWRAPADPRPSEATQAPKQPSPNVPAL